MLGRLLLLFILIPFAEMALLIQLGNVLGFWPTIALVIATGVLGAFLARGQGVQVLRRIQLELSAGRMPATPLLDGLLILIGGIVLLTPGLLTDLAGIVLLLPFTRRRLRDRISKRFQRMIEAGQVNMITFIR
ncbi:MAG: membrane protein FxsA [Gemmatimonas sp.]|nr:membrane protein FxsA [Gemmatimonas sp.]